MIPTTNPAIKRLAVQAVRDNPARTFKDLAKDYGIDEKTLRKFAKAAGIVRKRGAKSWRIRVHPRDWTPLQRRLAQMETV
jgi:hypothetical protein